MCIGTPMQVVRAEEGIALCRDARGNEAEVDLILVGRQPVGAWLLVHLGAARSVMEEDDALKVSDALQALEAVLKGESVDHLFADLVDREPELPDFLKDQKAN